MNKFKDMQLLRRLTVAVCAAALSLCARAESAAVEVVPKDRPLKVLMIGNSFSLSNFRQMPKVAAAMGRRLDLASIHIGGCSLERHWNNVLAASTNATFRPYKLNRDLEGIRTARDVMVNIPDALVLDKWDVVTIQQASSLSWRPETYQPFGDLLVAKISEFAPQAKIVVQETWSYPPWDKRLANFGFGPEEMYRRLHDAYGAFAKKHGFDVVPVGAAAERFPNRESLFTKPDFHFNRDGEYLQGLVFTAKLFGADVRKCAYKPDWMDASRAKEMKNVAMEAVCAAAALITPARAETIAFPDAPFAMPAIAVPQFAARDFSIVDFGAKEGVKATEAFAKAMAACEAAGGGRVVVPKGTWLTGAVHFRNNCNLHLADGATLEFTDDPADYLPVVHTSWEGVECLNYSPLLYGYGVTNVAITGKGTIAPRMDFWKTWFTRPPEHMKATEMLYHWCSTNAVMSARDLTAIKGSNVRPHLIQFNRCENVLLDGFRIRESPFWTIHLYHSENCVVRNLDVYAHGHNNDGVDIEMTRNVLVENCSFDQGDDGIVLKAGRNQDAWRLNRPTENIVVRNCEFAFAHTLLGIGSELSGGIRNVWMHHCKIGSAFNLFYVKTNRRRGGFVKNIWFEDVEVDNLKGALCGVETDVLYQWAKFPDYELRRTDIEGLHVRNVRANCADYAINIRGDAAAPIRNVELENVWLGAFRKSFERVENVEGIQKRNVRLGDLKSKPWVHPIDEVWHRKPAARVREPNYDEAKVAPYTLEDPLTFADGRKLKDASEWPARRKEILEIFAREMFGVEPPAPKVVVTELREEGPTLAGLAIRRQYRMWFKSDKSGPFVDWLLVLPNRITGEKAKTADGRIVCENREKVPVVLMLNFPGNHAVLDDEEVPLTEGGWFRASGDSGDHGPKESNRGTLRRSQLRTTVPAEFIVSRGYAFLTACYAQVSPDVEVGSGDPEALAYTHVFELWGKRDESRTDNTTALGAWAWALSRGLDLAEKIPEIDAKRCVATGSSRLAKAALLASARDERFAVCVPNQTGGGGVPLAKRNFGENISTEMRMFPHWYCKAYAKYIDNEQAMKFDQHLLVAAIAPRALLVEGFNQGWFDAKGEWLSCRAASPVWEFLGKEGLPKGDFPDNYDRSRIGSTFGYVRRGGQHGLSGYDWLWMLDFADKAFSEE